MTGQERRDKILLLLNNSENELSANFIAKKLNVSRQVIVGDIALLRATGHSILAKPKGYILDNINSDYKKYQIIVKHSFEETLTELEILVKNNIIIYDVTINHPSYGLLKGELNIKTNDDITQFIKSKPNLLSSLTDGIHVHTLLYKDQEDLDKALKELNLKGFIYND
ncbi:predicted transcriptional repressor (NadR-like) [Alteracholeplasma palmae J233]|uniref:Predicted transcriptional repressor (NadR-like) n=1 Tax=Alteracholeplasma palmae (strain ATCC 49389 / J233) TaxID=1318466 RepID=U4KK03_ALTPJ|nr:transcription repressor NadR [Alteracholeplasma palmae]CCV63914.1 predicted transcriptional repressor (NadR-like) [Alteracholeplasma palmae J233]